MKNLLILMMAASASIAPAAAQSSTGIGPDRKVAINRAKVVEVDQTSDAPAANMQPAEVVPGQVYTPPEGYSVAYQCNNQCSYWLVENDTWYDIVVYAGKVAWVCALALLGIFVCLLLISAMFATVRDMVFNKGAKTKKLLDEMTS